MCVCVYVCTSVHVSMWVKWLPWQQKQSQLPVGGREAQYEKTCDRHFRPVQNRFGSMKGVSNHQYSEKFATTTNCWMPLRIFHIDGTDGDVPLDRV